jgi:hypothetical protein
METKITVAPCTYEVIIDARASSRSLSLPIIYLFFKVSLFLLLLLLLPLLFMVNVCIYPIIRALSRCDKKQFNANRFSNRVLGAKFYDKNLSTFASCTKKLFFSPPPPSLFSRVEIYANNFGHFVLLLHSTRPSLLERRRARSYHHPFRGAIIKKLYQHKAEMQQQEHRKIIYYFFMTFNEIPLARYWRQVAVTSRFFVCVLFFFFCRLVSIFFLRCRCCKYL